MQTRTRKIFMALVGAYLVYMGVQLINSVLEGNPQNKILFIICGVVFALFGAATVIFNIMEFIKAGKAEQDAAEEEEEGQTDVDDTVEADAVQAADVDEQEEDKDSEEGK